MSIRNDGLIKTFIADGVLQGRRLVTFGTGRMTVRQANAASDALIGITTQIGSENNGRVDVIVSGITEAVAGGTLSKGTVLTSNSEGKVITATQAADRIIGIALEDAEVGDYAAILLAQG
ncbi:hypothetical protein GCM10023116_18760 [Kistimonas scapharcae]|uniref:DUF2190 domain-containing protein n=1 Tax=Kistimonas scapharcae TaxID=1036133 RepID=A0ABP8V145_9GAMM|nr:MAG: hypothetical protein B0D91_14730 [Oceanospirillales bacterium LUC14_002_19_P2]